LLYEVFNESLKWFKEWDVVDGIKVIKKHAFAAAANLSVSMMPFAAAAAAAAAANLSVSMMQDDRPGLNCWSLLWFGISIDF